MLTRCQQHPRAAVSDLRQRLNRPDFKWDLGVAGAADSLSKTQPFGTIIVTVTKQVLDQGNLYPPAKSARWQGQYGERGSDNQHAELEDFCVMPAYQV